MPRTKPITLLRTQLQVGPARPTELIHIRWKKRRKKNRKKEKAVLFSLSILEQLRLILVPPKVLDTLTNFRVWKTRGGKKRAFFCRKISGTHTRTRTYEKESPVLYELAFPVWELAGNGLTGFRLWGGNKSLMHGYLGSMEKLNWHCIQTHIIPGLGCSNTIIK